MFIIKLPKSRLMYFSFLILLAGIVVACTGTSVDGRSINTDIANDVEEGGEKTAVSSPTSFNPDDLDLETYQGLPVGFTEDGFPFRGNPDAPITLVEFSDYLCPFCGRYTDQTLPSLLETYGSSGQVKFVFHDFPIAALHPTAPKGHAAALCVAEQSATLFWEMHDQLFATQTQWASLPDPSAYTAAIAESIGVDMDAYESCIAAGETQAQVNESVIAGQQLGFRGTPTFQLVTNATGITSSLVGAQPLQTFASAIDSLLGDGRTEFAASNASEASVDPQTIAQISFDVAGLDLETYQGLPVGFTEEGYPFRGNPDAELTLVEFSDYLCPFCNRHFSQTLPTLLQAYGAGGDVNFVFRDFPLVSLHPTAPIGHASALCVAEQGAALFWEMHDQLFVTQSQWSNLPDPTEYVADLAKSIGTDMNVYQACMAAGQTSRLVEERVAAGLALGFAGTPTFQLLNNANNEIYPIDGAQPYQAFADLVDTLLAGETPNTTAEPDPSELPFWASPEGLTPDPDRPGFTLAGDPYKGNPDASVVIVEFADFQCPACQTHALEKQPILDESFVDSNQIMWVFKNLPLKEHEYAPITAVAAECAGDQGQFWDMHDLLFETLDQWLIADDIDIAMLDLAAQLELDMEAYEACFNSRQALSNILDDLYDAQGVANQTPNFVVLVEGRGTLLQNSPPIDQFITLLQSRLENEVPDS